MLYILHTQAARFLAISAVAGMSRFYLLTLNDMRVKEDEQHAHLVQLVKERPPGTPIITVSSFHPCKAHHHQTESTLSQLRISIQVSNHCSTLDDPALFAIMMPWEVNLSPKKVSECVSDNLIRLALIYFSFDHQSTSCLKINR